MAKYTFIRNSLTNPNRNVIQTDNEYIISACFSMCDETMRHRLESFLADPTQEKVTFEFPAEGETVEVWRDV